MTLEAVAGGLYSHTSVGMALPSEQGTTEHDDS